ncbi:MAG: hypothetical protein ABII12_07160 [Planctomycetota bacterium]
MKKALLLAAVVGLVMGSTAIAQPESIIWLDVRDNDVNGAYEGIYDGTGATWPFTNGGLNGGGPGDGQVMYINPEDGAFPTAYPDAWPNFDGDGDTHTGYLVLYMTVNDDMTGGATDVISSVGLDFNTTETTVPPVGKDGNNIGSFVDFNWSLPAEANSGTAKGAEVAGDPPSWTGAKAVKVPVEGVVPAFAVGSGMVPTNTYRIGKLEIEAAARNRPTPFPPKPHVAWSTFNVYLSVNELLVTRVFSSGGDQDEQIHFGYSATVAGSDTASLSSGSTLGAPFGAGDPDAVIKVLPKGDNSGNGLVNPGDITGFTNVLNTGTAINQKDLYLNDFAGTTPFAMKRITPADVTGFVAALANG